MIDMISVQPGTTLFKLAANFYGDATQWIRIARANGIQDPFSFGAPITLYLPANTSIAGLQ
jgi:hypothetical protein